MNTTDKSEEAVEKALGDMLKPSRNVKLYDQTTSNKAFVPPTHRSVRELVEEIEEAIKVVDARVKSLKVRLDEFYRLQNEFYVGDNLK